MFVSGTVERDGAATGWIVRGVDERVSCPEGERVFEGLLDRRVLVEGVPEADDASIWSDCRIWVPEPPMETRERFLTAIGTLGESHVVVPVEVREELGRVESAAAKVLAADPRRVEIRLDSTRLGITLTSHVRARCQDRQRPCLLWLEGSWAPTQRRNPPVLEVRRVLEPPSTRMEMFVEVGTASVGQARR